MAESDQNQNMTDIPIFGREQGATLFPPVFLAEGRGSAFLVPLIKTVAATLLGRGEGVDRATNESPASVSGQQQEIAMNQMLEYIRSNLPMTFAALANMEPVLYFVVFASITEPV